MAAISSDADLLVYASEAEPPRQSDLFAVRRSEGEWGEPQLISGDSPYLNQLNPKLSADGARVVFQCGDDIWYRHSICEVDIDGSGFREVVSPDARESPEPETVTLHNPTYDADGGIVFAGSWDGERIWRLSPRAAEPEPVRGDHWNPCVLPDGRIAALFADWSKDDEVPDYHINVISPGGATITTVVVIERVEDFTDLTCGG